jgi:hypothetical protein
VIASDNKDLARLAGLKIIVDELSRGVKITEQELDPAVADAAFKLWGWRPGDKK